MAHVVQNPVNRVPMVLEVILALMAQPNKALLAPLVILAQLVLVVQK